MTAHRSRRASGSCTCRTSCRSSRDSSRPGTCRPPQRSSWPSTALVLAGALLAASLLLAACEQVPATVVAKRRDLQCKPKPPDCEDQPQLRVKTDAGDRGWVDVSPARYGRTRVGDKVTAIVSDHGGIVGVK